MVAQAALNKINSYRRIDKADYPNPNEPSVTGFTCQESLNEK